MNHWTLQLFSHPNPMDASYAVREAQAWRQSVFGSPNDVHVKTMMILYGGQIAVGDWCYI